MTENKKALKMSGISFKENVDRYFNYSIEYYVLARYSYQNSMHYSFIVNYYWCFEYMMLSVLCQTYRTKKELKESLGLHNLQNYWGRVKQIRKLPDDRSLDSIVDYVSGFIKKRYYRNKEEIDYTFSTSEFLKRMSDLYLKSETLINVHGLDSFMRYMVVDVYNEKQKFLSFVKSIESLDVIRFENLEFDLFDDVIKRFSSE